MTAIANRVYSTAQVRELDRIAIQEQGIPAFTLMSRAGEAVFAAMQARWPQARSLCVLCGAGNNAGDGYIVARLALQAGWEVALFSVGDVLRLQDVARQAYVEFMAAGGNPQAFDGVLPTAEVYLDALLGTGLERDVEGAYADAINLLNQQLDPVVAVDVPSGLQADTGQACGSAVQAALTVTFIGQKSGLLTGKGRDYCGELVFASLDVPAEVYAQLETAHYLLGEHTVQTHLPPRPRSIHKGDCGHTLLVGGASGMSGAVKMAAEAALRSGSGLVSVATHPEHAPVLNLLRPEMMVSAVESPVHLRQVLQGVSVVGIGTGMGQTAWARGLLTIVQTASQPKVVDADALNLLANVRNYRDDWILTPHPGEAARLLGCSVTEIEQDRLDAVRRLQAEYGGVIVLKGAGTLVAAANSIAFCPAGNPGMASGGMGDVLTGVISGLLAQGLSLTAAAETGVWVHAHAADLAALEGERGLLASDVIAHLRKAVNL